ncbi:thiamine-monophosphate kinase [Metabacillus crassostreae]|uniref:thiamine-phosphate kinase n=1 Tax=Metabacillus crassostreae TaxID=929098 RepID=UPI0019578512|nr:thiamine-phosphate kinase [Metabacillus crassostreae]MBM7606658.1 thiamine-monophosphate kinase [Metabacillus crassostreae]
MDEFEFINKVKPTRNFRKQVMVGIGDDAAVYQPTNSYNQVVCVDTMVEGVHFLKNISSPQDIGYKALAVNISDIAAMGALPIYYLVSIAIPSTWTEAELIQIYEGMEELSSTYRMDLIGGDTVSTSDKLVITVTVIGEAESHVQTLRNKAEDRDIVFVTGTIGDSSAGLSILLEEIDNIHPTTQNYLMNRHKRPIAQVEAGQIIAELERASLNDISDGLASELNELIEASKLGMIINEEHIPVSKELRSLQDVYDIKKWILYGGEDFELVGTTSEKEWDKLKQACKEKNITITKIGVVTNQHHNVLLKNRNGQMIQLNKSGYNHFKNK